MWVEAPRSGDGRSGDGSVASARAHGCHRGFGGLLGDLTRILASDASSHGDDLLTGHAYSEGASTVRARVVAIGKDAGIARDVHWFEVLVEVVELFVVAVEPGDPERLVVQQDDGEVLAVVVAPLAGGPLILVGLR